MIFAAGLGTRLKPLTDSIPKALVEVGGRPLLWWILQRLMHTSDGEDSSGYTRMVVNVHHFAGHIVDYLQSEPAFSERVLVSDESETLLETGGGLKKAAGLFEAESPILIHNVDILDNVDYGWFARQHLSNEDAVLLVSSRQTKRYLLFNNSMRLMGWVNVETGEVRSPFDWLQTARFSIEGSRFVLHDTAYYSYLNMYAFSGIHSFSPRLFRLMERFPDRFSIIDFYLQVCHRSPVYGCLKDDLEMLDVGKLDSLSKAETFIQTHRAAWLGSDSLP